MNTVELFYNFTPNRFQFYYFASDTAYYNAISSHIVGTQTLDNARLMNNVLKIKKPSNATENYTRITYVREDRGGFIRYYFVVDVQYFGDSVYQYVLTPDKWANYIAYASFDHIFLNRCNRHLSSLPSGKFDDIVNTDKYAIVDSLDNTKYVNYTPLISTTITEQDMYIAFSVVFQNYKAQPIFGDTITTSDVAVFCVNIRDLVVLPSELQTIPLAWIERALNIIGGIYAMNYQSGNNWGDDLEAYVSGIWLLPKTMIPNTDNTLQIRFKTAFSSITQGAAGTISTGQGLRLVRNSFISLPYNITVDETCDIYFGTKSAMLKLSRTFDNNGQISPRIECIVKKDDIQIIARCGDDQLDITQSFSVGVPNATGATSAYEKIARGVSTIGAFRNTIVQGANGNGSAVLGGVNVGLMAMQETPTNAQYKSNGDGLSTWVTTKDKTSWSTIEYPISYTKYKSAQGASETEKALRSGATFNQFINNISSLFTARAIVTGVANNTVFVQATMDVENIPTDAAEYIATKFADGIELTYVS